ncbi:MAG TPA: tyrosine-protein phosphatase [Pyrinomonadaceae bacterium]|nr:tyrosine-protein phosphatase [Pyrinomonadaceae bacterium]
MKQLRSYFVHAALVISVFAFALVAMPAPAHHSSVSGVTIDNFGKINDNYYRGSQPNQVEFAQLKRLGIKTVIDLREDYKKTEETWVRDLGMTYVRIPLKTRVAATEEQWKLFLGLVNDPASQPVYVHCKGGRHRTGAMTAIYRITHDSWTADQAYQEMKDYDFENGFFGGPAAQKNFVYSFYQTHQTVSAQK